MHMYRSNPWIEPSSVYFVQVLLWKASLLREAIVVLLDPVFEQTTAVQRRQHGMRCGGWCTQPARGGVWPGTAGFECEALAGFARVVFDPGSSGYSCTSVPAPKHVGASGNGTV